MVVLALAVAADQRIYLGDFVARQLRSGDGGHVVAWIYPAFVMGGRYFWQRGGVLCQLVVRLTGIAFFGPEVVSGETNANGAC